jgi:acyl carrier protein
MTSADSRTVAQHLADRLPHLGSRWRPDRPLAELNLDSLDTVELLMVLDELYGVRLTSNDLAEVATVGKFCELVARRAVQPADTTLPCPTGE